MNGFFGGMIGISICALCFDVFADIFIIDSNTPIDNSSGGNLYSPSSFGNNSVISEYFVNPDAYIVVGRSGNNSITLSSSGFYGAQVIVFDINEQLDSVFGVSAEIRNSKLNSLFMASVMPGSKGDGTFNYDNEIIFDGLFADISGSEIGDFYALSGYSYVSGLSGGSVIAVDSGSLIDRFWVFDGSINGFSSGFEARVNGSSIKYFGSSIDAYQISGGDSPHVFSNVSLYAKASVINEAAVVDVPQWYFGGTEASFNSLYYDGVEFEIAYAARFGLRGAYNGYQGIAKANKIKIVDSDFAGNFAAFATSLGAGGDGDTIAFENHALVKDSKFGLASAVHGNISVVRDNSVSVFGSVGDAVAGVSYADPNSSYFLGGSAFNNSAFVYSSTVYGRVLGAQSVHAYGNQVVIKDSAVGSVLGAESAAGDATDNIVHLYGKTQVSQDVYGGVSISAGDALSGNRLFIEPTEGSVSVGGGVSSFSEINIDFSDAKIVNNGPSALIAAGVVDLQFGGFFTEVNLAGVSAEFGRLNLITAGSLLNYNPAWVGSSSVVYDFITINTGLDNSQAPTSTLYVDYGLSWFKNDSTAHGTFTLNDDDKFSLEVNLVDQTVVSGNAVGWDGKTLIKKGNGTLILEGENTHTGGTYIQAGMLQIGDGDDSGSILGAVIVDGVLAINRSDTVVLSNLISGSGAFAVLGNGSVELTQDNGYSGGTDIEEGTLIVSNLSSIGTGAVRNESNLLVRSASGDWINPISGDLGDVKIANNSNVRMLAAVEANRLTIEGSSQASIADGQSWLVRNLDNDGTLTLGDNTHVVTRLVNNSVLQLRGGSVVSARIEGDLINQGQIRIGQEAGANRLTVDGDYLGENASLLLDSVLADDDSVTDRFIITGKAYGSTAVVVRNLDGAGAESDLGIRIIDTAFSESNAFYLPGGYIGVGAYDYQLINREEVDGDNWYLSSRLNNSDEPLYNPILGSIFANQSAANNLFNLRYDTREGAGQARGSSKLEDRLWVRFDATKNRFHSMSNQLKTKGNSAVTQIGMSLTEGLTDMPFEAGVLAGYAQFDSSTHASASERKSSSSVKGYSIGTYATWYANPELSRGLYVDSWLMWNSFDNQLKTPDGDKHSYDSSGITASIEVGKDFSLGSIGNAGIWLQPQAQLIYQGVRADKYRGDDGLTIKSGSNNVQLRTGLKAYADNLAVGTVQAHPFIALNYIHNTNPYSVKINHETMRNQGGKNLGEVKLGLESQFNNAQLWFDASYTQGSHGHKDYGLNVGFKYPF